MILSGNGVWHGLLTLAALHVGVCCVPVSPAYSLVSLAQAMPFLAEEPPVVDPDDVNARLSFDGRIAEDFKLASGTWVNVGALRVRAILHFAPLVRDAVVTGHDRDDIGLLSAGDHGQGIAEPARDPLAHRAPLVEELYGNPGRSAVIVL